MTVFLIISVIMIPNLGSMINIEEMVLINSGAQSNRKYFVQYLFVGAKRISLTQSELDSSVLSNFFLEGSSNVIVEGVLHLPVIWGTHNPNPSLPKS